MILWLICSFAIILADQITKYLAMIKLDGIEVTFIPKIIDFVYVKNNGAAFNMMSGKIGLLSIISVAFALGVIFYMFYKKPQNKVYRISVMLLFAGAVGNVIDRIFRGYVVDFIKTTFIEFPVFNIADISIVCGAILLVIYVLFLENRK